MQLVFVFNLNKRAAVLSREHFLLRFEKTFADGSGSRYPVVNTSWICFCFYNRTRLFFFFLVKCLHVQWTLIGALRERKQTQKVDSKSRVSLSSKTFTAFFMTCTFSNCDLDFFFFSLLTVSLCFVCVCVARFMIFSFFLKKNKYERDDRFEKDFPCILLGLSPQAQRNASHPKTGLGWDMEKTIVQKVSSSFKKKRW